MSHDWEITWKIDMEAETPEEAACKALIVMRDADPANTATVFEVRRTARPSDKHVIDLSEPIAGYGAI